MSTLFSWSSLVQAIGRWHWVPWFHSAAKDDSRPSSNGNARSNDTTLSINNKGFQAKLKSGGGFSPPSINSPTGPGGNTLADDESVLYSDDEDNIPTLNDVESLKVGIIKTSKNKANKPYTILLVGETGVGKSSVLEFIANVLTGRDIDHCDFDILDRINEQGGSEYQSQTTSARLYKFTSKNGIVVRILDTPGLADTRSIQQDELHKKSIARQIKEHMDSITAVLVLANGTVPRITVGTDYALSTLSAIFPKSLACNISFMFTNVLSPLHWNFSLDTVPQALQDAPQFLLNNPVSLQRKYLKIKDDPNMRKRRVDLRNAVKAGEQNALKMLVKLFDWLDGLEPQGSVEIVKRSQKCEVKSTGPLDQAVAKKAKNPAGINQSSPPASFKIPWLRRGKKTR